MGVSATWIASRGRWKIQVRWEGRRVQRLAPLEYGRSDKRRVLKEVAHPILRDLQDKPAEADQRPTLWNFCAEIYPRKHGVSPRTWRARRYKVAAIMADLGDHNLDDVTTKVVTDWMQTLAREGAPLQTR